MENINFEQQKNRKLFIYAMLILEENPNLDRQKIEEWRDGICYKEFENLLEKKGILGEYGKSREYLEEDSE